MTRRYGSTIFSSIILRSDTGSDPDCRGTQNRHAPRRRGIQYAAAYDSITAAGGFGVVQERLGAGKRVTVFSRAMMVEKIGYFATAYRLFNRPSKRIRQLDLRLQRRDPPLRFPGRQIRLEQFRLIRFGAERTERRQLAWRHRRVDLVGEAGHRGSKEIFCLLPTLNLKFVLYLFL
jgi:hypothetical protein